MFHKAVQLAQSDLSRTVFKPTEEDKVFESKQEAVELSENAMEIEKLQYSANDLSAFSAMTDQHASENYDSKMPTKEKELKKYEEPHKKDFFEQLYEKQQSNNL